MREYIAIIKSKNRIACLLQRLSYLKSIDSSAVNAVSAATPPLHEVYSSCAEGELGAGGQRGARGVRHVSLLTSDGARGEPGPARALIVVWLLDTRLPTHTGKLTRLCQYISFSTLGPPVGGIHGFVLIIGS